jgi:hypothetical protein
LYHPDRVRLESIIISYIYAIIVVICYFCCVVVVAAAVCVVGGVMCVRCLVVVRVSNLSIL